MLCDEIGNLGNIDAFFTAATLLSSWGLTLWTFWQIVDQLRTYGALANTIIDNAGVIQIFGVRNYRMAQEISSLIGGISPDELLRLRPQEQVLLMESKLIRCLQVRHYEDQMFRRAG
jgi:type IV secretory pathway TraG/TraD family ATPase VirD4